MESRVEELEMAVVAVSDEKEVLHKRVKDLGEWNVELKQEAKHLTAKFNSRI